MGDADKAWEATGRVHPREAWVAGFETGAGWARNEALREAAHLARFWSKHEGGFFRFISDLDKLAEGALKEMRH